MSYRTRGGSGYNSVRRGKNTFKKGQRVFAKMGSTLPQERVFIKDVKGNQAHISWEGSSGIVDGHIDVSDLSHKPDKLSVFLSNDPYSKDYAYSRVLLLLRRGEVKDLTHALQNYVLEMDADPDLLPPKLVEYAKKRGWLHSYKLGDSWSKDFDYDGMLKYGSKIKVSDGIAKMQQLFYSMEDVNYHSESSPLWDAIGALEAGDKAKATKLLKTFNGVCKKALKS